MVVFTFATYCLINYDKEYQSPFTAFVIQAFNFAWTIFGLIYLILQERNIKPISDFNVQKTMKYTSQQFTTKTSLSGAITAVILGCITYYLNHHSVNYHNILALTLIFVLNYKLFNSFPKDVISLFACSTGIILFQFYLFFSL